MFGFLKKKNDCAQKNIRESRDIIKAREYLESIYPTNSYLYGKEPFYYIETTQKGIYKRYHFYKGFDKKLIYIVLSPKERNEIQKVFNEKKGKGYVYQDTILSGWTGNIVQHRFYRPKGNTSITFMSDDGEIRGGNFAMDEDMD